MFAKKIKRFRASLLFATIILPGKTYKLPLDIRDSEMTRAFAWIQPQG